MNYIMHSTKGGRKAKERWGKHKTGSDRGGKNALAEIGGCGHEQLAIESFLSCILFQVYLEFTAKGAWVVGAPWHSGIVSEFAKKGGRREHVRLEPLMTKFRSLRLKRTFAYLRVWKA